MKSAFILVKRNVKLFFKDKGMFFTALITPAILLILYITFLGNVYRDSFTSAVPEGIIISDKITSALVGGQLISSLLAVSCVTVAFCSNFLMVQDKSNGTAKDLKISPIKPSTLAISYYAATLFSTLFICLSAAAICLVYLGIIGWYLSALDVFLIVCDVLLLVLFGTALSSVISFFLSTQGQISAVGSIVSAGYGFICGAYMPISSFNVGMQRAVMFLPGTHGTSLLRNHALRGVLSEMEKESVSKEVTDTLRDLLDCNIYFFEHKVTQTAMYAALGLSTVMLIAIYIILNRLKSTTKQ